MAQQKTLLENLKERAKENTKDWDAQYQLGLSHELGKNGAKKDIKEALKWYELASKNRHAESQYKISILNPSKKLEFLKMAADNDHIIAQYQYGWHLASPAVTESERCSTAGAYYHGSASDEAITYLKKSAAQGYAEANYRLGICVDTSVIRGSRITAKSYYEKAAQGGYAPALYALATANHKFVDIPLLTQAADKGHLEAQIKLAQRYADAASSHTSTYEEVVEKAFHYYNLIIRNPSSTHEQRAKTKQNELELRITLGKFYQSSEDKEKYADKAFLHLSIAANEGNLRAKFFLGKLYEEGQGCTKNSAQAARLYVAASGDSILQDEANKALSHLYDTFNKEKQNYSVETLVDFYEVYAENNNADALHKLGELYKYNNSIKDIKKAYSFFEKAAAQNNCCGQNEMGLAFHFGEASYKKDSQKANNYFQNALSQACANAQYTQGNIEEEKNKKITSEALVWYQQAAIQNHPGAQYKMGCYYESIKDPKNALKYYQDSAAQGFPNAQNRLGKAYETGTLELEANMQKAEALYTLAAAQNHAPAQANLARFLSEDAKTIQDKTVAAKKFQEGIKYYALVYGHKYNLEDTEKEVAELIAYLEKEANNELEDHCEMLATAGSALARRKLNELTGSNDSEPEMRASSTTSYKNSTSAKPSIRQFLNFTPMYSKDKPKEKTNERTDTTEVSLESSILEKSEAEQKNVSSKKTTKFPMWDKKNSPQGKKKDETISNLMLENSEQEQSADQEGHSSSPNNS